MEPWLAQLLASCAEDHPEWSDMHWSTQRRIAITRRWPAQRQAEAMMDQSLGRAAADGGKWELMVAEIAAIKAAIDKVEA